MINLALIPNALVVHNSMPVTSMKEVIEYEKQYPGKLAYGTYAIGSINHLAGILIAQITGIPMVHVSYKGGAPAVADLLSGQLPIAIVGASSVLAHARSGKLRLLGVIESRRFPSVPGVPSIGETVAGYALPDSWFGFLGPAGINVGLRGARRTGQFRLQRLHGGIRRPGGDGRARSAQGDAHRAAERSFGYRLDTDQRLPDRPIAAGSPPAAPAMGEMGM